MFGENGAYILRVVSPPERERKKRERGRKKRKRGRKRGKGKTNMCGEGNRIFEKVLEKVLTMF